MTKTEEHVAVLRRGHCVVKNLFIWFPQPGDDVMLREGGHYKTDMLVLIF
jgi:hypothetical protein